MRVVSVIFLLMILLTCTSLLPSYAQISKEGKDWVHPGYDFGQTYFNPQNDINKNNLDQLELKWIYRVPPTPSGVNARGGVQTPLLVVDGIIYMATSYNRVIAISGIDGKEVWSYQVNTSSFAKKPWITGSLAQHSISYYDGAIYMQASDCTIYALNAQDGKVKFTIPDICKDIPGNKGRYFAETNPVVYQNLVIAAPAGSGPDGRGFIAAYDMNTKQLVWRFFTVPPAVNGTKIYDNPGPDKGKEWGVADAQKGNIKPWPGDWGQTDMVSAGVIWQKMIVDDKAGILYTLTASTSYNVDKGLLPGPNLFTSGAIALNAKTGELIWYYAADPHSISVNADCGWGATLASVKVGGQEKTAVIAPCKGKNQIFTLDAQSGKPLLPPVEIGLVFNGDPNAGKGNDADMYARQKGGMVCPGHLGGIEAHVAFAYNTIFAPVQNACYSVIEVPIKFPSGIGRDLRGWDDRPVAGYPINSTLYAIDASNNKIKWEYFMPVGYQASHITISSGVVYAIDRSGILHMLDAESGKVLKKVSFGGLGQDGVTIAANKNGGMLILAATGDPAIVTALGLSKLVSEKAVTKEVMKETTKTEVETVSPISYAALGISVVILVIAGALFTRRKKS